MSAKANEKRTFSIAESTELVRAMLRQEKVHDMNVSRSDFAELHPILSKDSERREQKQTGNGCFTI